MAGARGLLLREVAADSLGAALTAVVRGLTVFDPVLADAFRSTRDLTPEPLIEELTPRELEVLQLLSGDCPTRRWPIS